MDYDEGMSRLPVRTAADGFATAASALHCDIVWGTSAGDVAKAELQIVLWSTAVNATAQSGSMDRARALVESVAKIDPVYYARFYGLSENTIRMFQASAEVVGASFEDGPAQATAANPSSADLTARAARLFGARPARAAVIGQTVS